MWLVEWQNRIIRLMILFKQIEGGSMKAIIFGATTSSKELYEEIKKRYDIVAYCDNDKNKWGGVFG